MTEIKRPVRPIQHDYQCDECGRGVMRPDGLALLTDPARFPHICTECGAKQTFLTVYPWLENVPDSNDLLSAACDACIDFYMQMHVSRMREQIEPLKKLWSIGQELYLAKRYSSGMVDEISESYPDIGNQKSTWTSD